MTLSLLLRVVQDSTAYVARPSGPPDTVSYMWAGYLVALVCFGGYIVMLARRITRTQAALDASALDASALDASSRAGGSTSR